MRLIVLVFFISINVFAFDQTHIDKLLKDEICEGCDFSGANLNGLDLSGYEMSESNFKGADLSNSILFMADLRNCDFTDAKLENSNFWKADLSFSTFINTYAKSINLKGAKLNDSIIENSDFSYSVSWKADFTDATIEDTDFSFSELGDAKFFNNDLTASKLDQSVLWKTQFSNTDLKNTQCQEAKIEEAIFIDNVNCKRDSFESYGHFKQMIQTKNLDGKVFLNDLKLDQKNNFAVGAIENAQGEISIFNGEFFITYGKTGTKKVFKEVPKNTQAMLLATMHPNKFYKSITIKEEMLDIFFYDYLEEVAQEQGIDISRPFLFVLKGEFKEVLWHIVNGRNTIKPKDGSKQKLMKKVFSEHEVVQGTVFGFYFKGPQGIFTHPGENYHAHFITKDKNKAGHIDNFTVTKGMNLVLAQ